MLHHKGPFKKLIMYLNQANIVRGAALNIQRWHRAAGKPHPGHVLGDGGLGRGRGERCEKEEEAHEAQEGHEDEAGLR